MEFHFTRVERRKKSKEREKDNAEDAEERRDRGCGISCVRGSERNWERRKRDSQEWLSHLEMRALLLCGSGLGSGVGVLFGEALDAAGRVEDRKSTRLNSRHTGRAY